MVKAVKKGVPGLLILALDRLEERNLRAESLESRRRVKEEMWTS